MLKAYDKLYEFECPNCHKTRILNYKTYWYAKTHSKFCNLCKPRIYSHLRNFGAWNKGLKMSKEWCDRLSSTHKNNKYWVGKKHKESSKEKQRLAKLGRKRGPMPQEVRKKISLSNIGKLSPLKGPNHPNWKGGITTKNRLIRSSSRWNRWRKFVFSRDNYTCQHNNCEFCQNKKGVTLHPHHVFWVSKFPELSYAVSNGITLCKEYHNFLHWGIKNV